MKFPSFLPPFRGRFLAAAALFAVLASSVRAETPPAPIGATFEYGALFTVAGYAAGKPALAGFPVLVRISDDSPTGFAYDQLRSSSTGSDLAFVDMDGNGIPFEIDTWDPNGTSLIWVRLPTMTNGTQFAMCWGSETSGKTFCGDNPFADYVGVWHMSEASGTVSDATGHGLGAAPGGATQYSIGVSGKIGGARQNSTAQSGRVYLLVPNYNDRGVGSSFTVSGWFNSKGVPSSDMRLFSRKYKYTDNGGWEVLVKDSGKSPKVRGGTNAKQVEGTFNPILKDTGWQFVTFVFDGTAATTFQNGSLLKTGEIVAATDNGQPLGIGSYGGGTESGSFFIGDMDEARLRPGTVTADWIAADYATQNDPAFLAAGEAEPYGETAKPVARVAAVSAAYTNATVSAIVSRLGIGATSADVLVEISASDLFANPVWTTNYTVVAEDTREFAVIGLATGTTYHVRATVENDAGADPVVTRTATFTTLVPGAPEGTAEVAVRGLTTLSVTGKATAFGEGATSATMRLEASTDASFVTLAGVSPEVSATPDAQQTLEVSGLGADTEYRLRLRLVNDWGVETFVALPATATLDGPVDASDIRWTFSSDVTTVDVFLDVNAVFDGGTGTATLYCDENDEPTTPRGDRTVSEPGTLTWAAIPFGGEALHARIVLESEAGGTVYTQAWTAVVDHNFKRLRPERLTGVTADGTVANPDLVFDNNLRTGVPATTHGYVTGDYTYLLGNEQEMYISRIDVTHLGDSKYSLYTSVDGTSWTLVPGVTNVQYAGTASYPVSAVANYVKCVFESSLGNNISLYEIDAWGYAKAKAKVVSNTSNASMCNADGSPMTANGQGGWNSWWGRLFDGNLTNYQMWPKAPKGGYALVDFTRNDGTANALQEYFVTELKVSSTGTKKFTLQYSVDGNDWIDVAGAVNVSQEGVATFAVAKTVKKVRYVFVDGSWNDFEDSYLAEFQVWGIDPNDAPCDHPSLSDWVLGAVPATCTERAMDSRICLQCGERFTKISDNPPLGHDYVSTVDQPGRFSRRKEFPDHRRYGTGSIACSRCSFRLGFPTALDLVTNKVGGTAICGVKKENVVRFTDLSVSSENHPEYGPASNRIIDGDWSLNKEYPHWYSAGTENQYADFEFGTMIDLTAIEFAVYNHGYHLEFCSVDDDTGTVSPFGSFTVVKDESAPGTTIEPILMVDPGTGREVEVMVRKEWTEKYQRILVPFFETPVKHLRIRIVDDEPISVWSSSSIRVLEIHPWGTVAGASDYLSEKTTIMILR